MPILKKQCIIALAVILFPLAAAAGGRETLISNNKLLRERYGHTKMSLNLSDCKNKYVARTPSGKSIYFDMTVNAGDEDLYLNKFLYAFFGPDGKVIDPYLNPVSARKIVDGGDDFAWTQDLKNSKYRVPANKSMVVIRTGANDWLVRAKPVASVPDYVPNAMSTIDHFTGTVPKGYSFAYHIIALYDYNNTENTTEDDQALSDCVFFYAVN